MGKRSGGGGGGGLSAEITANNIINDIDKKEQVKLSNGDTITKIMSNTYLYDSINSKDALILKKGELKIVLKGYYDILKNSGKDTPIEKLIKETKAKIDSSIPKNIKKNFPKNAGKYERSEVNLKKAFNVFDSEKGFEDKVQNISIMKVERKLYYVKHPDVLNGENLYSSKDLKSFIRYHVNDFKDTFPHKKAS